MDSLKNSVLAIMKKFEAKRKNSRLAMLVRNIRFLMRYDLKDIDNPAQTRKIIREVRKGERIHILSYEETIELIIKNRQSIARVGEGEFGLIFGGAISFQEANEELSIRLKQILCSNEKNITIGIGEVWFNYSLVNLGEVAENFIDNHMASNAKNMLELLDYNKTYIPAGMTQVYQIFKEYDFEKYFDHIKQIWKNKDVTIVCGEGIFRNIDNNIFDCARSVEYVYAPSRNAFAEYDAILENAKKIDMSRIVVLILGPTATVLAYDLAKLGYWALDFGHIAKDYDAYIKKKGRSLKDLSDFFDPD